jgi:murein DD-endopeptidase MepM/ murein hydrolase activator NlpD
MLVSIVLILSCGWLMPEHARIPVLGATPRDWNPTSFWHGGWGQSGVHKGIDIFAPRGTPAIAATSGIVIYRGDFGIGGNVVMLLGPQWHVHYYAHLQKISTTALWVSRGDILGTVGDSGNAKGKSPHLHYAIISLFPLPWRWDTGAVQGWKKMFYLNPQDILTTPSTIAHTAK